MADPWGASPEPVGGPLDRLVGIGVGGAATGVFLATFRGAGDVRADGFRDEAFRAGLPVRVFAPAVRRRLFGFGVGRFRAPAPGRVAARPAAPARFADDRLLGACFVLGDFLAMVSVPVLWADKLRGID